MLVKSKLRENVLRILPYITGEKFGIGVFVNVYKIQSPFTKKRIIFT